MPHKQILYQIIWSTKCREKVLTKPNRDNPCAYIAGIIRHQKCVAFAVNGVEDHLHIIMALHPTVALSGLVKDIKLASSYLIKEQGLFFSKRDEG